MSRPNIVFLTVGCSNSTIAMRMLGALGWNLADADDQFAESVSVRAVNGKRNRTKLFDATAADKALAALPQPWAIKDPRFCETLRFWRPLLEPYRPFLLWVTKDHDYVRASFERRFKMPAQWADNRLKWCQTYFAGWPWGKLKLDTDQIAAAVSLFNPARAFAHAPRRTDSEVKSSGSSS